MLQDQSYMHNKKYWKPGSDDIHPHTASTHIAQEKTTHPLYAYIDQQERYRKSLYIYIYIYIYI
jgi:hypothetical protein